jgi:polyisoprenoid-binding protein YceI
MLLIRQQLPGMGDSGQAQGKTIMTSQSVTEVLATPGAGTYRIDGEQSRITYTSRHMFGLGKVHARFNISSGVVDVGSSLGESRANATIDSASFTSDNAKRDADVKGPRLLDAANYPRIQFTSTAVWADKQGTLLLGTVAMRGVETAVAVAVLSWEAPTSDRVHVLASATHLDRCAFGITGSRGFVGRYFDLSFDIWAVRTVG